MVLPNGVGRASGGTEIRCRHVVGRGLVARGEFAVFVLPGDAVGAAAEFSLLFEAFEAGAERVVVEEITHDGRAS